MTKKPPAQPDGEAERTPDGAVPNGGTSGEGAHTALEALIRRRQQAGTPIDPPDTGSPKDEPAR